VHTDKAMGRRPYEPRPKSGLAYTGRLFTVVHMKRPCWLPTIIGKGAAARGNRVGLR